MVFAARSTPILLQATTRTAATSTAAEKAAQSRSYHSLVNRSTALVGSRTISRKIPSKSSSGATTVRWNASKSAGGGNSSSSGSSNSLLRTAATSFGIGSLAGMGGSLAGMGGGFVMIPLMTSSLLRLTQHQAHGTSLFAVMATGMAGAISYGENVQLESAAAVALCGMFSARVGAKVTNFMSERMLKRALGILMLAMAPAVPLKAYVMQKYATKNDDARTEEEEEQKQQQREPDGRITTKKGDNYFQRFALPGFIGLGSGFLAGVFGVGGGVIVVPALAVATSMDHYQALGTSLAAMTPPAAVGTYTHYAAGNLALRVAPPLALGAFCGAYVGGKIGKKTDETTLRWGFSGLLTVLGIQTILKTL